MKDYGIVTGEDDKAYPKKCFKKKKGGWITLIILFVFVFSVVFNCVPPATAIIRDTVVALADMLDLKRAEERISVADMRSYIAEADEKTAHPYVLATQSDFDKVRTEYYAEGGDGYIKDRFGYTLTQADKLCDLTASPLCLYEFSDGERLLEVSREVLSRMMTLGCAFRVTGDEKYAYRAWQEMQQVCVVFPDWHEDHFLDSAEMALAMAIGYDWFFDYLTEEQKQLLADTTYKNALKPAMNPNLIKYWYSWSKNNWNSVCYGGIGIAAMVFNDYYGDKSAKFLSKAFYNMPIALEIFSPDGVYVEGNSYWEYGISYLVYFISTARNFFGTDFGLSDDSGFKKVGYFPINISTPTGVFNYGDNKDEDLFAPCLFWFAKEYDEPLLAYYQKQSVKEDERPRESALSVLWYNTAYSVENPSFDVPLSVYSKSDGYQELVTMRSAYLDKAASYVGIKSGYNYTNHGDLDIGSFVLDSQGERWITDLGKADYNAPGYFLGLVGAGRWKNYRKRAEGHNTLVINPSDFHEDQYPFAEVPIDSFTAADGGGTAVIDMTDAYYRCGVKSVKRTLTVTDNYSKVTLSDEVACSRKSEIYWFAHTKAAISIAPDGKSAVLTIGEKKMKATLQCEGGVFTVTEPVPLGKDYGYNTPNEGISKLTVHLTEVKTASISVTFTPIIA